jgi:hypothetical protein
MYMYKPPPPSRGYGNKTWLLGCGLRSLRNGYQLVVHDEGNIQSTPNKIKCFLCLFIYIFIYSCANNMPFGIVLQM